VAEEVPLVLLLLARSSQPALLCNQPTNNSCTCMNIMYACKARETYLYVYIYLYEYELG
jgi:hypothetical protein